MALLLLSLDSVEATHARRATHLRAATHQTESAVANSTIGLPTTAAVATGNDTGLLNSIAKKLDLILRKEQDANTTGQPTVSGTQATEANASSAQPVAESATSVQP